MRIVERDPEIEECPKTYQGHGDGPESLHSKSRADQKPADEDKTKRRLRGYRNVAEVEVLELADVLRFRNESKRVGDDEREEEDRSERPAFGHIAIIGVGCGSSKQPDFALRPPPSEVTADVAPGPRLRTFTSSVDSGGGTLICPSLAHVKRFR